MQSPVYIYIYNLYLHSFKHQFLYSRVDSFPYSLTLGLGSLGMRLLHHSLISITQHIELTGVSILNTERQIEWAVDNKYYSTTITIHIHHMTKGGGGGGDDEWDCEAVIFLSSLLQV